MEGLGEIRFGHKLALDEAPCSKVNGFALQIAETVNQSKPNQTKRVEISSQSGFFGIGYLAS